MSKASSDRTPTRRGRTRNGPPRTRGLRANGINLFSEEKGRSFGVLPFDPEAHDGLGAECGRLKACCGMMLVGWRTQGPPRNPSPQEIEQAASKPD